jgi:hypothetical protein
VLERLCRLDGMLHGVDNLFCLLDRISHV